jgi:uracil-DNA glycosylase
VHLKYYSGLTMALPAKWKAFIESQQGLPYYQNLMAEIAAQRQLGIEIYPADEDIFNALNFHDVDAIKVVILGQDPYHARGQAHGLAFSVNENIKTPPSLVNIYKELAEDIDDFKVPSHGNLKQWAEQGVLLLNTVLTVQQANAHSHAKLGWETFTDNLISLVDQHNQHCVFLLWGSHAQNKGQSIDQDKHLVLKAVHPSPLSAYRGFFGCRHFSVTNQWLKQHNIPAIDWQINDCITLELF